MELIAFSAMGAVRVRIVRTQIKNAYSILAIRSSLRWRKVEVEL